MKTALRFDMVRPWRFGRGRARLASTLIVLAMLCVPGTAKDAKAAGRIGELSITATGIQETGTNAGRPVKPGFHTVRVTMAVRNVGKDAVCTYLKATLESTFGVETKGFPHFKDKSSEFAHLGYINQLLPGESLVGEFEFPDVRDESHPVKLRIQQQDLNQGCGKQRLIRADELTIKVTSVPTLDSVSDRP